MLLSVLAFLGSWLLVAGGIFQATLDLRAQEIARDRIEAIAHQVTPPPHVSAWWWLFPPVKILREQRRRTVHHEAFAAALSLEDFSALLRLRDKAYGWLFVALGAFLIAIQETHALAKLLELRLAWAIGLTVVMTLVTVVSVVSMLASSERAIAAKRKRS